MANSALLRVVLDTNILISAVLKPDGLEAAVVNSVLAGSLEAWITREVWAEYEEVFARPKFANTRESSARMLGALRIRVQTTTALAISTLAVDDDDNRFIECAEASQAHFLVTGNLRHYPAEWAVTRAVNARQLFEKLQLSDGFSSA